MTQPLDCHRVVGNLLQGSYPTPGHTVSRYAQVLVLCARELQPPGTIYPGLLKVVHCPLNDDGSPMTEMEKKIARTVAKRVRLYLDQGLTVLSTCHMGLNRSGLVSALALMLPAAMGRQMWIDGSTPSCLTSDQATYLVRRARGDQALGNQYFTRYLAQFDGLSICRQAPTNPFSRTAFLP